jgi:hypothetical protein
MEEVTLARRSVKSFKGRRMEKILNVRVSERNARGELGREDSNLQLPG